VDFLRNEKKEKMRYKKVSETFSRRERKRGYSEFRGAGRVSFEEADIGFPGWHTCEQGGT
jgi:hypothetical protein